LFEEVRQTSNKEEKRGEKKKNGKGKIKNDIRIRKRM